MSLEHIVCSPIFEQARGDRGEYALQVAVASECVFEPDQAWWQRLFAAIDARDAAAFVDRLTSDAQFKFGNAPTVIGSEAIGIAAGQFFAAIASCRHRLLRTFAGSDNAAIACEGVVTYRRHDGSSISVPFANVFELRGEKIATYRIYIDNSPLFDPTS
jgi:ketosteroid isomerase-like protein